MAQDISKRSLTFLVAAALLVSLASTAVFYSRISAGITAAATSDQALARVNITSRASINWTVDMIDWGSGYVNDTVYYCQLNSEGLNNPSNCTNFTTVYEGLRLENDGNRNVDINLSSNNSASQFLGGSSPLYQWKLANNESDSCGSKGIGSNCVTNVSALQYQGSYSTVSTSPTGICPCFRANNPSDLLNVELQIRIPSDSYSGLRESVITAVATAI